MALFQINRSKNAPGFDRFEVEPPLQHVQCVLRAICHASSLELLVQCILGRYGFGDSDGGFGVTYSTDLDEYDREVEGVSIPQGWVEAYCFWGSPDGYETQIPEHEFVDIVHQALVADNRLDLAAAVSNFRRKCDVEFAVEDAPN